MLELDLKPTYTLSVAEAAEAARVTPKTIYRAITANELVSRKQRGRSYGQHIAAADLQKWIEARHPVKRARKHYRALSKYHGDLLSEAMQEMAACSSAFLQAYEALRTGAEEIDDAQAFEDALRRDFAVALEKFSFTAVSRIALNHAAKELAEAQDAAKNSTTKQNQNA